MDESILLDHIEIDPTFMGKNNENLIKFNPLANMSTKQVWSLINENNVKMNKLFTKGFTEIGCQPCTKPHLPNDHIEGR